MKKTLFYKKIIKIYALVKYYFYLSKNLFLWFIDIFSIKKKTKLLFIYDFTYQPFSIGDFLVANAASLCIAELHSIDEIDLLILFDKNNLTKTKEFSHINSDNIYFNISSLLPIAQINQHFSSLLIFDNRFQADKYILDNIQNYKVYPNMKSYGMGTYYYWDALNSIFPNYYNSVGHPPYFICKNYLTSWVNQFFLKYAHGKIVVTINLRNNKNHGQNRNSKLDEWYKYFNYCIDRFNVKFIVICSINEVDERWRQCSNVLVAKDFHTFIEHDLALINNSHFHMGSPSGPFNMALFGRKPYIMFNFENEYLSLYKSIIEKDGYLRFSFANPLQLMTLKEEFFDNILFEFLYLYNNIEQDKILVNNEVIDEGLAFLR